MNGSRLLGWIRAISYLAFTFASMPVQAVALIFGGAIAERIPRRYHKIASRILGFRIVVRGTPSTARPTLFVSNHTSYFDIILLGSILRCSFVAKAEMTTWPLIGKLAKLQRSVFVDRRTANVSLHSNELTRRLEAGDNIVLFAEGTTSDGNRLLPFKSSLLSVAENVDADTTLTIQPVSIVATALDGMPMGRSLRSLYAWYGDMPLMSHTWAAIKSGIITVEIEFHEPMTNKGMNRKQLTARCEAAIEAGFVRSITGRPAAAVDLHDVVEEESNGANVAAA
jgi:1-acyl-sn-glycerol-3-phosphate acyltransferase